MEGGRGQGGGGALIQEPTEEGVQRTLGVRLQLPQLLRRRWVRNHHKRQLPGPHKPAALGLQLVASHLRQGGPVEE